MLAISGVAAVDWAPRLWHAAWWWLALDLAVGILSFVAVAWRRRFPVSIAIATNVAATFCFSAAGPSALALTSMATRRRWREIALVGAVLLASIPAYLRVSPDVQTDPRVEAVSVVAVFGFLIGWGMYIGSRRELLATLRSRAEIAEAEQAAKVAGARIAERARIAREMHDVLAHRISLVAMHAGALAYRDDLGQEQTRETARTIQDSAHQAMRELRAVLGVLREGPGDARPELPQPTAEDVPDLVEESRHAGMRVELVTELDLAAVPDTIGRTVFRVVQEGLTNARKHAPDTSVRVRLATDEGDDGERVVGVEVENPLRIGLDALPPGSGLGLPGLAERVALVGGSLEHAVTPERRFTLRARIPWPA